MPAGVVRFGPSRACRRCRGTGKFSENALTRAATTRYPIEKEALEAGLEKQADRHSQLAQALEERLSAWMGGARVLLDDALPALG
jgi:methylphosphotriester-DNA--protein-cysteine methyltransferase